VGLEAVIDGVSDSHVEHGGLLNAFAEAIVARDEVAVAVAREALIEAMGEAAMVDAAGVASNFERNVRIADGAGIPLDEGMEGFSGATREQLDLNRWRTS
jgi:hypothetical protein